MEESHIRGMSRMKTGRGPFQGEVIVGLTNESTHKPLKMHPSKMRAGLCTAKGAELEGSCCIVLSTKTGDGIWSITFPNTRDGAVSCETVAKMICNMNMIYSHQLEDVGFHKATWLSVAPVKNKEKNDGEDAEADDT